MGFEFHRPVVAELVEFHFLLISLFALATVVIADIRHTVVCRPHDVEYQLCTGVLADTPLAEENRAHRGLSHGGRHGQ